MSRQTIETLFRETIRRLDPAAVTADAVAAAAFDGPVTLVAVGKAALSMTRGALSVLGDRVAGGCVVVPNAGDTALPEALQLLVASHPVATRASQRAGEALLRAVGSGHPVLALISGGASSLACVPAPGISLDEKLATTIAVMHRGAPIAELNTVRKHLSAFKGGQLAVAAAGSVTTFAISDVVGDRLSDIGSGPTVADPTTVEDARRIIGEHPITARLIETPKRPRPGDSATVIAGTSALVDRAAQVAREHQWDARIIDRDLSDDVETTARNLAQSLPLEGERNANGTCLIAGGEPTITLPDQPGTGGRAQHLALLLARTIRGRRDITILVAGSDGIDGNSDAAGAIVDGSTWDAIGEPETVLSRADAGTALSSINATLVTGPTGVNHADLILILC